MNHELNRAVQLLKSRQPEAAQKILKRLCAQYPNHGDALNALGFSYLALNDKTQAIATFKKLVNLAPDNAMAWENLGGVYLELNELAAAKDCFLKAVEIDNNHHQAWHFLSLIHFRLTEYDQALESQGMAEESDPFKTELDQAQLALDNGDNQQVFSTCQFVLQRHQRHPRALFLLAILSAKRGDLEQAIEQVKLGLSFAVYDHKLRNLLSQLQAQLRHYKDAIEASTLLVKQAPEEQAYWRLHADNLNNVGDFEGALAAYYQVDKLVEESQHTKLQQAHIHKSLGQNEASVACYRDCIDDSEQIGSAYWGLVNLGDSNLTDADIQRLEALALDPEVSVEQAYQASFALATCYEKNGQYEKAFAAYQSANLNRTGKSFLPEQYQRKCDAIIQSFNDLCMATRASLPDFVSTPIFIVGLPCSGATLVEQILANHSLVEGTIALKTLPAIARQVFLRSRELNGDASGRLDKLSEEELSQFGQMYLLETEIYRTDKPYFIDKLPSNFQHVGLIKKILPHAITIDVRKQPLAFGFDTYKQHFGLGHEFSYNLGHIAFYYQQYLRLMAHWERVLPEEIFLCQYEKLVLNQESEVRQLLTFCGLPFEDHCLTFNENKRVVGSACTNPISSPIHRQGLDLWKNYREQLEPLKVALGKDVIDQFSEYTNP